MSAEGLHLPPEKSEGDPRKEGVTVVVHPVIAEDEKAVRAAQGEKRSRHSGYADRQLGELLQSDRHETPGYHSGMSDDAIFVFAGRESRKRFGVRLYREGRAPRLLLSVGRFEWRRFADLSLP